MLISIQSNRLNGIKSVPVTIECEITDGCGIHLIGLADAQVKESLNRSLTALQSKGYTVPGKKIIINIAPCDLRKEHTSRFDLPIALAVLIASGQVKCPEDIFNNGNTRIFAAGEMRLDGNVADIPGAFQTAEEASKGDNPVTILPYGNRRDLYNDQHGVKSLQEAIDVIQSKDRAALPSCARNLDMPEPKPSPWYPLLSDLPVGEAAKRGALIIAAGGHHGIFVGADTVLQSRLAEALTALLPPMDSKTRTELQSILSTQRKDISDSYRRPFVEVLPSDSIPAINGNESFPGKVSLAHGGTLFLRNADEMPKLISEILRAPVEDHFVNIHRPKTTVNYPSHFLMIAGMKPCPCGHYGEGEHCTCTAGQRMRFLDHAYGRALYDHTDLHVFVRQEGKKEHCFQDKDLALAANESYKEAVRNARRIQKERFAGLGYETNADMTVKDVQTFCIQHLDKACRGLVEKLIDRLGLSARSYMRILKTARTIADLDGSKDILPQHLAEAASYRFLERKIQ